MTELPGACPSNGTTRRAVGAVHAGLHSRIARAALALLVAGVTTVTAPGGVQGQGAASEWFGGLFYDGDYFAGSSPVWTDWWTIRAVVNRSFDGTTLGLETTTTHRFGRADESLALDAYQNLWDGSYAHVRGRVAPRAQLLPLSDWRAEVFQALPGGWEASANVWLMNLPGPDVEVGGVGLARYVGQWYLRTRGSLAAIAGEHAGAGAFFARRFLGESRQYLELGAGLGEEVVILGPGPILEARNTWFLAGTFRRFFVEPFGIHLSASLNDFEGIPLRRHLTVGLIGRF